MSRECSNPYCFSPSITTLTFETQGNKAVWHVCKEHAVKIDRILNER